MGVRYKGQAGGAGKGSVFNAIRRRVWANGRQSTGAGKVMAIGVTANKCNRNVIHNVNKINATAMRQSCNVTST